jgi:hypothetical protein
MSLLAVSIMEMGCPTEATELFTNVDVSLKHQYGAHFPDAVQNVKKCALSLRTSAIKNRCRDSLVKCGEVFTRVITDHQRYHGNSHPATLDAFRELAFVRICLQDYANAEKLLRWSLEKSEKAHGLHTDHILQCATDFARLWEIQGHYAKGEAILDSHIPPFGSGVIWTSATQQYFNLKSNLRRLQEIENNGKAAVRLSDLLKCISRERILGEAALMPVLTAVSSDDGDVIGSAVALSSETIDGAAVASGGELVEGELGGTQVNSQEATAASRSSTPLHASVSPINDDIAVDLG